MLSISELQISVKGFSVYCHELTVDKGEILTLLGKTGAGKSMFIEAVSGMKKPDKGEILLDGRDITFLSPDKRGIGVVFQELYLFPHLNVYKNIFYSPNAKENDNALGIMVDEVKTLFNRDIKSLSGGEKQKVALARALAMKPRLLLLDEPFAHLDRPVKYELMQLLMKIKGIVPIIFVTHDFEEAIFVSDTISYVEAGIIEKKKLKFEFFEGPETRKQAEFLGIQNILNLKRKGDIFFADENVPIYFTGQEKIEAQQAVVSIRPEEILITRGKVQTSARNMLRARIVTFYRKEYLFNLIVEMGKIRLYAAVTPASFNELELKKGDDIYIVFKASSVHPIIS